jgi:hypothetical protein
VRVLCVAAKKRVVRRPAVRRSRAEAKSRFCTASTGLRKMSKIFVAGGLDGIWKTGIVANGPEVLRSRGANRGITVGLERQQRS